MKVAEKEKSIDLRKQGWSIKRIAKELSVAKSSVSVWVRDIVLTDAHIKTLKDIQIDRAKIGGMKSAVAKIASGRQRRLSYQNYGIDLVSNDEPLFIAGCMLYWAEGEKSINAVRLTNSDPNMIKFFKKFMDEYFGVLNEDYVITLNFFTDKHSVSEVEDFWINFLELSRSNLRKGQVNNYSKYSLKKRLNKLEYGTCTLKVYNVKIVQAIYGGIQKYVGFSNIAWLG